MLYRNAKDRSFRNPWKAVSHGSASSRRHKGGYSADVRLVVKDLFRAYAGKSDSMALGNFVIMHQSMSIQRYASGDGPPPHDEFQRHFVDAFNRINPDNHGKVSFEDFSESFRELVTSADDNDIVITHLERCLARVCKVKDIPVPQRRKAVADDKKDKAGRRRKGNAAGDDDEDGDAEFLGDESDGNGDDMDDDISAQDVRLPAFLKKGTRFRKYGRKGKPKPRFVGLTETHVLWGKTFDELARLKHQKPRELKQDKCIRLKDILRVEEGKNTDVLKKKVAQAANADHCFSLVTSSRSLDLEAKDLKQRREWVIALKRYLLAAGILEQ